MTELPLLSVDRDPIVLGRGASEPAARQRHRAKLPPRHLADLDLAARRAAVASLGEKEFRWAQLSTHYFGRLERDPQRMTDIPVATRGRLAGDLLPQLLSPVRELACDDGATRKALWRLHDG